ncbi:MAG: hypothetical protein IJJ69_04030 [Oscillospiraceae bacterium]|nr:hypothetical protein [Oscillospiraceae bacterium]
MAYTGTGTEADPYLVSTFADFLTCVAINGAYVKVTADIDASQEEAYQSAIETPITFSAAKVYADSMKEISNAIVQAVTLFLLNSAYDCTIENIYFKDVIYKCYSDNSVVFHSVTDTRRLKFKSCAFTIYGSAGNKPSKVGNRFHLDKCFFKADYSNISFPQSGAANCVDSDAAAKDSIFEISGMTCGAGALPHILGTFTYCTVKVNFIVAEYGQIQTATMFGANSHDNILILSNYTISGENGRVNWYVQGMTAIDTTNTNTAFQGSTIFNLTEQQIKSEEYLRSINFIP